MLKIISVLIVWSIFAFVILQVPYPDTITQANVTQLLAFFISLYLAFLTTFNMFLKNILISGSISLGLIFLLILKALDSLNLITGILIAVVMYLLISYFRKAKRGSLTRYNHKVAIPSLTKWPKIPKLTRLKWRKHE